MKKSIAVFFSVCLLLVHSCKKEDMAHRGTAIATKNGIEWIADPSAGHALAYPENFIGINAEVSNSNGHKRESLYFEKVPLSIGVYPLGRTAYPVVYEHVGTAYYTLVDDGDVLGPSYALYTTQTDNFFEVLNYSESNEEIEIRYSGVYVINQPSQDYPDTLKFTNGYIKTRIQN